MLAFIPLLLAASVAASPLGAAATSSTCPSHARVFSALNSYTSASQFCSTFLGISPVTKTASTTSISTSTTTTTIRSGTTTTAGAGGAATATVTLSTTITTTVISTTTTSLKQTGNTVIVTSTQTTANIAHCAAPTTSAAARVKRDTSSQSTPTQLSAFNSNQLSAGCSCLSVSTRSVTVTSTIHSTATAVRSTTILAATATTTVTNKVTHSVTLTSTVTSVTTKSTTIGSGTGVTSTTVTHVAKATPTSFYLRGSNGYYASIANVTGGALFLDASTKTEADTFGINSVSHVYVTTPGSQYLGYVLVGTPSGAAAANDWNQFEVTSSGSDGTKPSACCGMTLGGAFSCNYGELFGYCEDGALFEGSQDAPADDYYYTSYDCSSVTLSVVST